MARLLYDLCAVLTPCGPLRMLVNLIQKEGRPLPGLLYEAEVNQGGAGKQPSAAPSPPPPPRSCQPPAP